jgi:hypothetical protein
MPNAIKYNVSAETLALKKGNFWIGTGDVGKGPTSSTGYYNGITPPSGGYTIYLNKETGGPSIYTVTTEAQMVSLTNTIGSQSFTTSGQCLNWFATQTDKMIFNRDFEPFITDGLVFYVDPSKIMSYITGNTSVYDVTNNYSGITQNGVSFSNENEGIWSFDGTDDNILFQNLNLSTTTGATFMFWSTNDSTDGAQSPFGYHRSYWTIRSSQTYIYIGYGGIEHSSSFERSSSFSNTGTNWRFLAVRVTGSSGSFFKDGVKLSNFSDMPSTIDSNPTMYIGRRAFPTPYSYNGNIGNILIYNRPLSDEEIVYNYEATGKRFVSLEVQSLVVAGGGSGGKRDTGGGGAGGLLTGTTTSLTTNTNYSIIVGAGAAAPTLSGSNGVANIAAGNNGSNSTFNTTTSTGGGGGATNGINGGNGGSGGGGASPSSIPGTGISGQGYSGGTGTLYSYAGGGGGGAGEPGGNVGPTKYASGGTGVYISEYTSLGGSPVGWFAGGGGGSLGNNDSNYNSPGGNGGGGTGGRLGNPTPINGTINTGGGGGAQGDYQISTGPAGNGGSGIVILRIPDVYTARFSLGVTSSVTKSGGYKYYKVTATSTTSETVSFS